VPEPEVRNGNLRADLSVLALEMVVIGAEKRQGQEIAPAGRLEHLYRTYAPDALRLAYLLTGDRSLAEDLAQDAFVRVLGRFHDLRNAESFWWYLRRTIVNLSNSHFRRVRVERAYLARERNVAAAAPRASGSSVEERDRMSRALGVLRGEQRAAIVLRYYEDLTEADTAEVLGCAVGTVKSLVSRGTQRLREELTRGELT
jgi:RNA polymerase sigma-70 factor (sigma-E family)